MPYLEWKLKKNRVIRVICKPWQDRKLKKMYNQYLSSGHSEALKQFKDLYQGKRCFIIGNGPSLKADDLDCLKNEYTFAANRIYEILDKTDWRPWAYVVVDKNFMYEQYQNLLKTPCKYMFLRYGAVPYGSKPKAFQLYSERKKFTIVKSDTEQIYFAEDISKGVSDGATVTFASIQLAVYMGFKEIYLLGVDFSYKNVIKEGKLQKVKNVQTYFNGKEYANSFQDFDVMLSAYKKSKEYADTHGVKIYNATRGGKLEVFERVDFDKLMRKNDCD